MSFDFSNVAAQQVPSDRTALFTFYRLEGNPSLTVRPATEANPAYLRAMLKDARESIRRLKSGSVSPEILVENREKDKRLFPKYIVTGWPKAPVDASGKEVPFSPEACAAFLAALPYDMFNELRDFCSSMDNFRPQVDEGGHDDGELTAAESEDLAGN